MRFERWERFRESLPKDGGCLDASRFRDFVAGVPGDERIALLVHAYVRYRELSESCSGEGSAYSVLISSILAGGIRPDKAGAIAILRGAYHRCGHGSDVVPPVTLAEQAFAGEPYSEELFDAVRVYRQTLRPLGTAQAWEAKRRLDWILWHDPRNVGKACCTSPIQRAIHAMPEGERFAWQGLLRHYSAGMNSAPGKAWKAEGLRRLSSIGATAFFARFEEWFELREPEQRLTPPGSAMLRLLLWYGGLADPPRTVRAAARVVRVRWIKPEPAAKLIAAYRALGGEYPEASVEADEENLRRWREEWARKMAALEEVAAGAVGGGGLGR